MLQFIVIGNLGANAEVKSANGKEFVTFQVSSNDSYTDEAGVKHESVDWISCAISGDRGKKLLPFLVKGKQVYVSGRGSFRCYSSEKARGFVGAGNIAVERIEFLSSNSDEVPRELFETDGLKHAVYKAYYIPQAEAQALQAKPGAPATLINRSGAKFAVDHNGFILPIKPTQQQQVQQLQQQAQQAHQAQQPHQDCFEPLQNPYAPGEII